MRIENREYWELRKFIIDYWIEFRIEHLIYLRIMEELRMNNVEYSENLNSTTLRTLRIEKFENWESRVE